MADIFERIEQQYEGQEHQFLEYQDVYIYFIFSFSWNVMKISWDDLKQDLLRNASGKTSEKGGGLKGWTLRLLHERNLDATEKGQEPSYQPNLVTKKNVLEKSNCIMNNARLVSPIEEYSVPKLGKCCEFPVSLGYTVRFFDNGSATCTFPVRLRNRIANFGNIHLDMHLARNIDYGDEKNVSPSHLTATFIKLPDKGNPKIDYSLFPRNKNESFTFIEGYCSLHDLFRRLLQSPPKWMPDRAGDILNDKEVLSMDRVYQDFETPFVLTVAQVERNSFLRFRKTPTLSTAKEVASILCKLTMDNRYIKSDFLHMSEDYMTNVLPFNKERGGLVNLCLDRRLFFMFSRRGAIALTANLKDLPACFVVPSFLNLCEALRARWHLGNLVNIKLDEAIRMASSANGVSPSDILEQVFQWRALFALSLRDPVPFLFDSGSITEVAEIAEKELWLTKLREDTYRKLATLDRLVQDLYVRKRVEDFSRWSGKSKS